MEANLSDFLRDSRRKANLSQTEAAARIGVSRMTVYRWEENRSVPREFELRAAMDAYGIAAARRNTIYSLREQRARRVLAPDALSVTTRVSRGDLLCALRGRTGWTQTELAARAAVPRIRLNNWENGLSWPDDATVHRLAYVLNATEQELFALTCAPLGRPEEDDSSLGYLTDRVSAFLALPDLTKYETEIHTVLSRLRALAPRYRYAEYELWYLEYGYALLLTLATRFREGMRWLRRAESRSLPVRKGYEAAWPAQTHGIIERIALRRASPARRRQAGRQLRERQTALTQWASEFSPAWEAANGMELSLALHLEGDDTAALRLAQSVFGVAAEREEAQPAARLHRYGELLAATQRYDLILDIFPRYLGRNPSADAYLSYYLGFASQAVGNLLEADALLGKALIAARSDNRRLLERDILSARFLFA